jgi:hypothetical protein
LEATRKSRARPPRSSRGYKKPDAVGSVSEYLSKLGFQRDDYTMPLNDVDSSPVVDLGGLDAGEDLLNEEDSYSL